LKCTMLSATASLRKSRERRRPHRPKSRSKKKGFMSKGLAWSCFPLFLMEASRKICFGD
jgi:hypothetical protein